jgi:hypothetical protein
VYEKTPATPYQRLLESPDVSDDCKAELMRRKGSQNPVALNNNLNWAVEKLLKLNREKASMKQASLSGGGSGRSGLISVRFWIEEPAPFG